MIYRATKFEEYCGNEECFFRENEKSLNQAKLSQTSATKIPCVQSTCTQPRKPGLEDH